MKITLMMGHTHIVLCSVAHKIANAQVHAHKFTKLTEAESVPEREKEQNESEIKIANEFQ